MAIPVRLFGGPNEVFVTQIGQLTTAPFAYDLVVSKTITVANTAVNFYKPIVGKQFVVTGILLTADKQITQDVLVDVYGATSTTSLTISAGFLHVEMLKNSSRDVVGLNVLATEGIFINAKADDNDIFVTIMGYYIPVVK